MEKDTTFFVFLFIWDILSNGYVFNKCARYHDGLCKFRNQKITLIASDNQPCIELFHAAVDVILVSEKWMDEKNVTRNESGYHSQGMGGIGRDA